MHVLHFVSEKTDLSKIVCRDGFLTWCKLLLTFIAITRMQFTIIFSILSFLSRHYKGKKTKLAVGTKHLKVITSFEEGNKEQLSRTEVGVGMHIMYL